ncbi:hypothetical protein QR680_014779 [Steinernema hermaphroditum]|uniref:G-protein coupled receptors family 1 profile domain-containing protein n=1 Tax=Steinernema hermaphroditum TaxID=289476 RepID=A0AA39IA19_9BILA|nr:hypothetical protein QR680_014779 [Steinernema hermaphroditum]
MSLVDLRITEDELLVFARHISPVYMAFLPFCVILNIIIIAATIKSSRLRSNCNILIALQAVSDIFVFSSSIYPAYNAFLGRFVSVSDCFFHQMIPFAGGCFSYLLVLLIGFDRYLCVAYPILYTSLNKSLYMLGQLLVCFVFTMVLLTAQFLTRIYDVNVLCFPTETMVGAVKGGYFISQVVISLLVIVVYSLLWHCLKRRPLKDDTETRKIIKSLTVVVAVHLLGWTCTILLFGFCEILISDVNLSQAVEFASGPFAAVNVTIPCIIYYKLSSVYRDEIRSLFGVKPQVVPT